MSCRVATSADSGRYRIVTDYVTDPGRDALLLRVRFEPLVGGDLRLYLRFDPTVNGNGGGGSGNGGPDTGTVDTSTGHPVPVAADPVTTTNAANRDYAQPVHAASPFGTPPEEASIGFVNGRPVGSASPLTWSAAQYVRLVRDIANTVRRYVTNQQQATVLTVTEPPDRTPVTASPVTVRGTSAPGNTVDVSAANIDANSANAIVTTTAAADGSWSTDVPRPAWSRLIEVQGFGQRFLDAGGATLGTVTIRANEISRFITFSVPSRASASPAPAGPSPWS
jgi:Glucodextranase, domain N